VLLLADGQRPKLILNDRLLHFHDVQLPEKLAPVGRWNGALVTDLNRDERSDLVLVGPGRSPLVLVHSPAGPATEPARWFQVNATPRQPRQHPSCPEATTARTPPRR